MSNVTLTIGGRPYAVACAVGEEEHVAALGRMIDGKLAALPGGQSHGETRALLFAALLLADQVFELEAERAANGSTGGGGESDERSDERSDRLAGLAAQLERLADLVEARA